MTLPPHHRQGFGTLMIEFSENPSGQIARLNSCMSQAMNYHEEQVKLVHQSDRSQISVSAATFSFGYLTLSVSSGTGYVSYPRLHGMLNRFRLQMCSLCSSPRV